MTSASLELRVAGARVERVEAPLLVLAFFREDRPLRGDAGVADWRLCGRLSRLLAAGRLGGEGAPAALLGTGGRLRAPLLLIREVGSRRGFGAARARDATAALVDSALRAGFRDLALSPPGTWLESRAEPAALVRASLLGAARALAEHGGRLRLALAGADPGGLIEAAEGVEGELDPLAVAVELAPGSAAPRPVPGARSAPAGLPS